MLIALQDDEEEGSDTPSGSQRSAALRDVGNDASALADCGAASTPGWEGNGPDAGDIMPLAEVLSAAQLSSL